MVIGNRRFRVHPEKFIPAMILKVLNNQSLTLVYSSKAKITHDK
ncbi:protein of unknown function [Petrocella atlantisensis]|uniref:Uncharacterized protein n=1 Tax=Petrocella atlantisensis TaxID=2173034 RepID=A0A3P7PCF7_9FIRM|nr:protein of unknown function [Petrocella atlantisensis]